jgi:hypothetical protein
MSDQSGSGDTPASDAPNKAQAEFDKYKARLGGGPAQGPVMVPWGMPPGAMPGWGMPPSFAPIGAGAAAGASVAQAGVGIAGKLGDTLRLGIEFLNAALSSGTAALSGMSGGWTQPSQGCGCGCGCSSCEPAPSCCEPMCAPSCCTPSVNGCC